MKPVYFPGLNALRAYAALSVLIYHVHNSALNGLRVQPDSMAWLQFFVLGGYEAVTLFFVLSGFLIAYLLYAERDVTGGVSARRFYLRRALRIYPLYYAVALIGFFVLPALYGKSYSEYYPPLSSLPLTLLMLPNLAGISGVIAHLWSIGIEEQFYLILPWVMRVKRLVVPVAFGVILLKLLCGVLYSIQPTPELESVILWMRFECMAVGVLGAWLYVHHQAALELLYRKPVQWLAWIAFLLFVFVDTPWNVLWNVMTSVVFLVIILNVATNPGALLKLERPVFRWLGDRSYGVYMLHYPVLFVVYVAAASLLTRYSEAVMVGTVGLTILGAHLSRQYLEAPFLRLKDRARPTPKSEASSEVVPLHTLQNL